MNNLAGCLAATKSYAAFIWPAYLFAAVVLGGMAAQSWRRWRASLRDLDRAEAGRLPRR